MKRRDFIKNTTLASSAIFVPNFLQALNLTNNPTIGEKKVVIIQLSGGNDGLNTIIPYQNDLYYKYRKNIALKNNIHKITDSLGLHENLTGIRDLYDKGELSIINNVGYPNPIRSHFRAMDIWQSASDANQYYQTGWIGRVLDYQKAAAHAAIEVDDSLSLALKGEIQNGIAAKNPKLLYKMTSDPFFKTLLNQHKDKHLSEHNMGYLYKTMLEATSSAKYIYETSKTFQSKKEYGQNILGKQLKTVSEFINSGLNSQVYYVSLGGFDTHANQNNTQKRLLSIYDNEVSTFVKDLKENNTFKDTIIVTFSEFGRRVKQNAANGTDHGTANNVFLIGQNLKKSGFYNEAPNLSSLDYNGDLQFSIDFRSIYANIIEEWLYLPSDIILLKNISKTSLI